MSEQADAREVIKAGDVWWSRKKQTQRVRIVEVFDTSVRVQKLDSERPVTCLWKTVLWKLYSPQPDPEAARAFERLNEGANHERITD